MGGSGVQELALLEQAGQALASASSFEEIKVIRDKAEAVRKYAQSASLGLDLQNRAAEVKLQAERQAGCLLAELGLRGGDRRSKNRHERLKLHDLGISRNQSTRWQLQARVPEPIFREYVQRTCANGKELTSANLMRFAKRLHGQSELRRSRQPIQAGRSPVVMRRPSRFTGHKQQTPQETQREIVTELLNHHQTILGIIEPMYTDETAMLCTAERRVLRYLLTETKELLQRLNEGLSLVAPCACHSERFSP